MKVTNKSISDFLSDVEMESVRRPIAEARTLPNIAYTSADFLALEIERIYMRHWTALCFVFDVPSPGDAFPVDYCGMPLVAVRGQDRIIRVFHNVCPYDGCPLVLSPKSGLERLISPYHGWEYDLTGKLVAIPYWDGTQEGNLDALKGRDVDLVPVHVGTFLETVFVNLDDDPEDFGTFTAPIERQFSEYDLSIVAPGLDGEGIPIVTTHERRCNWKTFYENSALNVLHENFVHDFYMVSPEVPRIKQDGVPSFENIVDEGLLALGFDAEDFAATYPHMDIAHLGKGDVPPHRECFGTHYPNFYISFAPNFIEITAVLPHGPENIRERQAILFHKDVAADPALLKMRQFLVSAFDGASVEDGAICEAVQRARRSPVFTQKFYSPFWDELHYRFNKMILKDLERK
ncbi:aromatic ring-hydroxylating oxygenase subunit alpha [Emcibacter nanhaiensis]|uniref:Rieske 2Fe-2S domain-containing protein n=1 Tax=Emcibacter nanhaiensis TaxID=1505037 RepID=A0A501P941_9PROT|nr:SRPBCC family protein [Emcibacter nanhaiensis]TPD56859.1 Rieske 2Fe-2S domain-containing protein [Emcibacter nanhaiensis]